MSSSISASVSATVSASASASAAASEKNPQFKIIGISLAVGSGLFIGASFVVKKKGLLAATKKYGNEAGEGVGYLKSWLWWTGMTMMIVGEILNFLAYAFTEAILVTPMGALSVVVCAILSHFFLKESLTFFGWIGCTLCIIGSVILALNAPEEQSVTTIAGFKRLFLAPGFLVWASLLVVISLVLIFYAVPRWGKKTMMVYISICSLIGGISVSCTQGLGASIVSTIGGRDDAHKNWFFWILFVIVVVTLLTEIIYLNKALELFNTSMVVPVYFCYFSSATLITSFILYQGLKASAISLITMVLGFLTTCLGITLLQMSKVDPNTLGKLDRKNTILLQASKHQTEEAEKGHVTALEDPGMDALRGGFGAVGSIIRARSVSRRMSNASSLGGRGPLYDAHGNLSTHGLAGVQRFQLSDNPMPGDAMDQISMHRNPSSASSAFAQPQRQKSQIKASLASCPKATSKLLTDRQFEESDVVHSYDYGAQGTNASHTLRPHLPSMPRNPSRQGSGGLYPPVPEEDEDDDEKPISPGTTDATHAHASILTAASYNDPYRQPEKFTSPIVQSPSSASTTSRQGLSGLFSGFGSSSGPDLTLGRQKSDIRGGGHRGVKDYPHLPKEDADMERDQRRGLVGDDEDGEADDAYRDNAEDGDVGQGRWRTSGDIRRLPDLPAGASRR